MDSAYAAIARVYLIHDDLNDKWRPRTKRTRDSLPLKDPKKKTRDSNKMKEHLNKNKICEACLTNHSVMTHHLEPFSQGGEEKESNYKAVCFDCHSALHTEIPEALKRKWPKMEQNRNPAISTKNELSPSPVYKNIVRQ